VAIPFFNPEFGAGRGGRRFRGLSQYGTGRANGVGLSVCYAGTGLFFFFVDFLRDWVGRMGLGALVSLFLLFAAYGFGGGGTGEAVRLG